MLNRLMATWRGQIAAALSLAIVLFGCVAQPVPAATIGVGATGLSLKTTLQGDITSANALGSSRETLNLALPLYLTGGTGAGQIDTFYAATFTIAASGSTSVDLNGALTDAFGNTVNFLHVKGILLAAASGNANDCQIGPGAANAFAGPWTGTTPLTAVSPGETYLQTKGAGSAAGWPVVAGTGDQLKLANSGSGTSVACTLYVWGTST